MDETDRRILNLIQGGFPVAAEPYRVLGKILGMEERAVWTRIRVLQEKGVIRRIGAVFDLRALGFASTLCAARVPADRVRAFADTVNAYAGVTHNYRRDHDFNVWFTLIAPSREDLDGVLREIREKTGVSEILAMNAAKTFKINASFDF